MNDIVVKTDKIKTNNKNLILGKQGENIARQIVFDFSAWHEKFGEGTLTLFVKRHGEDASYPVIPVVKQTTAYWNISSTDTAIYGGGSAELCYVVNNVVVKSETFQTFVYRSITETTAPAPDPYESWVETLVALGDETRIYAERAEAAASSAKDHDESAQSAAENAESYSSHPPRIGEDGNWELWDGTGYASTDYPSRGERGETGAKGERGEKGEKGEQGDPGTDYVLTPADKTEIAQQAAQLVDTSLESILGNGVIT